MTAREYLEQAYHLDQQINSKIEQVESLHALATKATATMNDSPVQQTRNSHSMEDVILNIIGLENGHHQDPQPYGKCRAQNAVGKAISLYEDMGRDWFGNAFYCTVGT